MVIDQYNGEWKDDKFHGTGTYKFLGGEQYVGGWVNGEKSGTGAYNYADGSSYVSFFHLIIIIIIQYNYYFNNNLFHFILFINCFIY